MSRRQFRHRQGTYSSDEVIGMLRNSGRSELDRRIAAAGAEPRPGYSRRAPQPFRRGPALAARAAAAVLVLGAAVYFISQVGFSLSTRRLAYREAEFLVAASVLPVSAPGDYHISTFQAETGFLLESILPRESEFFWDDTVEY